MTCHACRLPTLLCLMLGGALSDGQALERVWSMGNPDQQAGEFALAPGGYADFLKRDFGWEKRFYLIGHSTPKNDWPYVLPGPADRRAGSAGMAGLRTRELTDKTGLRGPHDKNTWNRRVVIHRLSLRTNPSRPAFVLTTALMIPGHAEPGIPGENA